jgi:hypothetical protein
MKGVKLCQHVKDDGVLCGSPALKRRSCCYFHIELRRRRKRMARARLVYGNVAELPKEARSLIEQINKLLETENLRRNSFENKTLRDTLGLKPAGSRLCETMGEGVGTTHGYRQTVSFERKADPSSA